MAVVQKKLLRKVVLLLQKKEINLVLLLLYDINVTTDLDTVS